MRTSLKVLAVVAVVLVGGAIAADRYAIGLAEDKVAEQVAHYGGLASTPSVQLSGFPFLTQAFSGSYDDIQVTLDAADLGQPDGSRAAVTLSGVQVPLSGVLSGSVDALPIDRIDGSVSLPYSVLGDYLDPGAAVTGDGTHLQIVTSSDVAGRLVPVTATAQLTIDGGDLVVVPGEVTFGIDLPADQAAAAREQVTSRLAIRHPMPQLPFGVTPVTVIPAADAILVDLTATGVVLRG